MRLPEKNWPAGDAGETTFLRADGGHERKQFCFEGGGDDVKCSLWQLIACVMLLIGHMQCCRFVMQLQSMLSSLLLLTWVELLVEFVFILSFLLYHVSSRPFPIHLDL